MFQISIEIELKFVWQHLRNVKPEEQKLYNLEKMVIFLCKRHRKSLEEW